MLESRMAFNNLINRHDFIDALKPAKIRKMLPRVLRLDARPARVVQAWSHLASKPAWWDVPEVRARWNELLTGDRSVDLRQYFCEKYLRGRDGLRGMSLGCGTGVKTMEWAATGRFAELDAFDISPTRIAHARELAASSNLDCRINFEVRDVFAAGSELRGPYDLVISEAALHHFSPLDRLLPDIHAWLKPGGFFLVDEFVGPTRFQWTDRQLEVVNGLLAVLPSRYRQYWGTGKPKPEVFRPSRMRMRLSDPSEAIQSSDIAAGLERHFTILERKPYGGTVLHLLLDGIAQHFLDPDDDTLALLHLCFAVEDMLLVAGDLRSDFEVFICGTKGSDTG